MHYTDTTIFVLGHFMLTHPVYYAGYVWRMFYLLLWIFCTNITTQT